MAELPPRLAPFHELLAAQKVIFRELFRMTMPHWIHLDLSMGQLRTLAVVASRQAVNVSMLAETLEGETHNTAWPIAFIHGIQAVFGTRLIV